MNKIVSIIIAGLLSVFSSAAFSQITITADDFLGSMGTTARYLDDQRQNIPVNVGSAGPNQMWDFSATTVPSPLVVEHYTVSPASTPYFSYFPNANLTRHFKIISDTSLQLYHYWEVIPTAVNFLGIASEVHLDTLDTTFIDYDTDSVPLPAMYGNSWTSVEADTFSIPGFMTIDVDSTVTTIDAWGTLQLSSGNYNVLRVRDDTYSKTYVVIDTLIVQTGSESFIGYTWISKDGYELLGIQSQSGETNPNFTDAQGLSILDAFITGIDDDSGPLASDFYLAQNYPNPFNPSTRIRFTLPQSVPVTLAVYNALGQEVATLVNRQLPAGEHSITWEARDLPSGIYYYRITAGKFRETRKAILIK
ncbi:MAG: T9SS type A sorting domain-containing protein [Calditrichaeota bacterium]|nr:T9SS type A sorting domain-containing protein [Calditrichota bacterium]